MHASLVVASFHEHLEWYDVICDAWFFRERVPKPFLGSLIYIFSVFQCVVDALLIVRRDMSENKLPDEDDVVSSDSAEGIR